MRFRTIVLAVTLALPGTVLAQTQIAPGVTYVPPMQAGALLGGPGGPMPLGTPLQTNQPNAAAMGSNGFASSVPGNPVSAPSVDMSQAPPTAVEQGFGDESQAAALRQAMADSAARSSARQRGLVIPAPTLANPVGRDRSAQGWLANWQLALTGAGVSADKVDFEANRLSRSDFEAWASRQWHARQGETAGVDALARPTGW